MTQISSRTPTLEILEIYSRTVDFYRFLVQRNIESNIDLNDLKYLIDDCFDALIWKDITFFISEERESEADAAADEFFEAREDYRDEHPEWYLTDWFSQSPLYKTEAA